MTPEQRSQVQRQIVEYDLQARRYERESILLQERRKRRIQQIESDADRRGEATPYVMADPASVAAAWVGNDPKLNEYNAGLAIVERRATMYATLATNMRMALMLDAFAEGINVNGSLVKPPTART